MRESLRSALLLLLFSSLMAASGWLRPWDRLLYDQALGLLTEAPADDVAILAVDEASLADLGPWPWSNELHARLVEQLTRAGARAIVLDLDLAASSGVDQAADNRLLQAVAASERVFLPVELRWPATRERQPGSTTLPALAKVAAGLGHRILEPDRDGILRGVHLFAGSGETSWPQLMLALEQWLRTGRSDKLPPSPTSPTGNAQRINLQGRRLIPFADSAAGYPRYSYSQVIAGRYDADLLRDRIVLVGVTARDMGRVLPTPLRGRQLPMPEVEIQANILDSLRQGRALRPVGFLFHLIVSGLIAALPLLFYAYLPVRLAPLAAAGGVLLFLAADGLLLLGLQRWLPPAAALLGLLLGYPFWRWQRLERLAHRFDRQLAGLLRKQDDARGRPAAELTAAMDFLGYLLPLRGWALYQGERQLHSGGEALGEPLQVLASGQWRRSGAELWIRISRAQGPWQLGLLWPRTRVPQGRSLDLLGDVARQFSQDSAGPGGLLARVQERLEWLREAQVRQDRWRRLVGRALDQLDEGLLVIDSLGRVTLSNPGAAGHLGCAEDEALRGSEAGPLLQSLAPDDGRGWQEVLQAVLLEGEPARFRARRGPDLAVSVQLHPLDAGNAGMHGVLVILSSPDPGPTAGSRFVDYVVQAA